MRFDYDTLARLTGGRLYTPSAADAHAEGMQWDSRQISQGDVYAALPGDRVDGYDFCAAALEAGASGVLIAREPDEALLQTAHVHNAAVVGVDDVLQALETLASHWRDALKATVIGLTGSNGKTTTKNLLRRVLSETGPCVATLANQNNELGVPATLLRAQEDTQTLVVEMGMRGLGQIEKLCTLARPHRAVITNVGVAHMELLGSRENIARAKAELIAGLCEGGIAYINSSDDFAAQLPVMGQARDNNIRVVYFDGSGVDPATYDEAIRPTVYASDISVDEHGHPSFTLHTPQGEATCMLQLMGLVNVHNACAAAAVASDFGMDVAAIARALEQEQAEPGRQDVVLSHAGWTVIDDSYNANPDSMRASLDSLAAMNVSGRRIAVLGDMGELGAYENEGHMSVGAHAAQCGIDVVVGTGPLSALILDAAREAGMSDDALVHTKDASAALEAVRSLVTPGDCVLVKASHSMGLAAVAKGLVG